MEEREKDEFHGYFVFRRARDKRGVNLFSDCSNRWKRERMVLCITGKRMSAVEVLLFVFFHIHRVGAQTHESPAPCPWGSMLRRDREGASS
jgi:hypothetical protein